MLAIGYHCSACDASMDSPWRASGPTAAGRGDGESLVRRPRARRNACGHQSADRPGLGGRAPPRDDCESGRGPREGCGDGVGCARDSVTVRSRDEGRGQVVGASGRRCGPILLPGGLSCTQARRDIARDTARDRHRDTRLVDMPGRGGGVAAPVCVRGVRSKRRWTCPDRRPAWRAWQSWDCVCRVRRR